MKHFFVYISVFFLVHNVVVGQSMSYAPYKSSFLEYLKVLDTGKPALKDQEGHSLGYVPPPFDLHFSHLDTSRIKSSLKSDALPASYDLRERGEITSVKDQGGNYGGNCWAFTTLASIESQWLKQGLDTFDLSEQHMVTCHGYEWGYGEGGNDYLAMAYLTRLQGPVPEAEDPYRPDDTAQMFCKSDPSPVAYVPEVRWIPNNRSLIKQTLMDYGAVSVSIHWNSSSFRSEPFNYYYSGNERVNHAVNIAGWNNNRMMPAGKGGWIVKNQWGTDWADSGYFYVDYADNRIAKTAAYYPIRKTKRHIHHLYYHDTLGPLRLTGYDKETGYGLTKFIPRGSEVVHRIGTFISTAGSIVDIEVYDKKKGNTLYDLIDRSYHHYCALPGYYTFDIAAPVDDAFYIKVKYFTPGHKEPIPVEKEVSGFASPKILTGEGVPNPAYSWTFTTAYEKPVIESMYPLTDQEHVSIHSTVKATFDPVCDSLDFSGIRLYAPSDTLESIETEWDSVHSTIHIRYPDSLAFNQNYTVYFPDSMLINRNGAVNTDTSWSFTTIDSTFPYIVERDPGPEADAVTDSSICLEMDRKIMIYDTSLIVVRRSDGTPIEIHLTRNTDRSVCIRSGELLPHDTYSITIQDSAFLSLQDSLPNQSIYWQVKIAPLSGIRRSYPLDEASGLSPAVVPSVIVYPGYQVLNKSDIRLMSEDSVLVPIDTIQWEPKHHKLSIMPASQLHHGTAYTAILPDSSLINTNKEYNAGYQWSFSTAAEEIPVPTKIEPKLEQFGVPLDTSLMIRFDQRIDTAELANLMLSSPHDTFRGLSCTGFQDQRQIRVKCPSLEPGTTYKVSMPDSMVSAEGFNWTSGKGRVWEPVGNGIKQRNYDLCIRAYSDTSGGPIAMFTVNQKNVCVGDTVTFNSTSYGSIDSFEWDFGSEASSGTIHGAGPHNVVYQSSGLKTITLRVKGPNGRDTLMRHKYLDVSNKINVYIPEKEKEIPLGKTDTIRAYGADSYTWLPTYGLDTAKGHEVIITPHETGTRTYSVWGEQGNCQDSDSIVIRVTQRPDNDDVCDAAELKPGINGPYTNKNATVQLNEPHPPTPFQADSPSVGCNTQYSWCWEFNAPTLSNSIWFTFIAPDSGKIRFSTRAPAGKTKEFDNQIALYGAENCKDLLTERYYLIAANDDYYEADHYSAYIKGIDTLTPGKRYWLQLDGSGRGQEGSCYVTYYNSIVGMKHFKQNESGGLSTFPNPVREQLNFRLEPSMRNSFRVQIFDMKGMKWYDQPFSPREAKKIHVENIPPGFYVLKIVSEKRVLYESIILQ